MTATAIITGGAGGMGLATAHLMQRDHRIVLTDVGRERVDAAVADLKAAQEAWPQDKERHEVIGVVADITDRGGVDAVFEAAEQYPDGSRSHVRAVVHTAGLSPSMADAAQISRVNAMGTVHVTQAYLERAREGDALVLVSSIAGHMMPRATIPTRTFHMALVDVAEFERRITGSSPLVPRKARPGMAYSRSKAFVIWYAERMARSFGAKGARVLSVSPGSFDTAMGRAEKDAGAGKLAQFAALRRFGHPEEIAAVLAFAASAAPGYLTGTDILVDGGSKAGLGLKGMLAMARNA